TQADPTKPLWFNNTPWGEDWTNHTRMGLSGRFDYRLSAATTVYANLQFSDYHVILDRRRGTIANPTVANLVLVTFDVTEARNQNFTYTQQLLERRIKTQNYQVGGESRLAAGKLDFQATLSPSKGHQDTTTTNRVVNNPQLRQDRSKTHKYVTLTQTGGPDIFDVRNQLLNTVNLPTTDLTDRVAGGQVNLTRDFATEWPFSLKVGGRYRYVRKTNDQTGFNSAYVGPNGVAGPVGAANDDNLAQFFDPNYHHKAFDYPTDRMQFFDQSKVVRALKENPNYFATNVATSLQDS